MATTNDFVMYKGEDITLNFSIYGSSSTAARLDPTGYTTLFSWKLDSEDTAAIFTVAGVVTSCYVAVSIASCQTNALASQKNYAHDLWRTDAGSLACLSIGRVALNMSVRLP